MSKAVNSYYSLDDVILTSGIYLRPPLIDKFYVGIAKKTDNPDLSREKPLISKFVLKKKITVDGIYFESFGSGTKIFDYTFDDTLE